MTASVEIPVWLLIVVAVLAAVAALDRVIGPGIRWVLRRRMERAVARLNGRLKRKIEPFRLAARRDMIVRLTYDARVMEAVADHAAETGVPGLVAFAEAEGYAREIVPGFSATLYFGIATRAARFVSRIFYRVRLGEVDAALAQIDPKATVIFVMNHRSNMDYVLITWLVAEQSALSYAVGEWARVWPLAPLIRAMGAFTSAGTAAIRYIAACWRATCRSPPNRARRRRSFPRGRCRWTGGWVLPRWGC